MMPRNHIIKKVIYFSNLKDNIKLKVNIFKIFLIIVTLNFYGFP